MDGVELRLYEAVVFGSMAAVAAGCGSVAARVGRPRWLGWVAVGVGGSLVIRSIAQIARWL